MKNNKIIIGVVVLVVFLGGVLFIIFHSPEAKTPSTPTDDSASSPITKSYSMSDVASHNSEESCWTTIGGNVYDLTSWIHQHPGGAQAILSLCGVDGTAPFTKQHGGQSRPEAELQSLLIGKLQ